MEAASDQTIELQNERNRVNATRYGCRRNAFEIDYMRHSISFQFPYSWKRVSSVFHAWCVICINSFIANTQLNIIDNLMRIVFIWWKMSRFIVHAWRWRRQFCHFSEVTKRKHEKIDEFGVRSTQAIYCSGDILHVCVWVCVDENQRECNLSNQFN